MLLATSPFEVDQHIHKIGPGLEHLRIGGIAALRLDHFRQFGRQIDIRGFQCTGDDRAEAGCSRFSENDGAGCCAGRIDIAGKQREIIRALHIGENDLRNGPHIAVLVGRIHHAIAGNRIAAGNAWAASVERAFREEIAIELRCLRKIKRYRISIWYRE